MSIETKQTDSGQNLQEGIGVLIEKLRAKLIEYSIVGMESQVPLSLVIILTVLQSLQIISLSIITPLDFKSVGFSVAKIPARVLNTEYYLRHTNLILYIIPLLFLFMIIHALILLWGLKGNYRVNAIGQYFFVVCDTIGMVPSLIGYCSVLACYEENPFIHNFQCFSGIHILYFTMSILGVIWCLLCTAYMYFFYIDRNPFNTHIYTCSSNLWILGKFIVKLASVIFILVDPNMKYNVLYIVSYAGINLANFAAIKIMWPLYWYSHNIQYFMIRCQIVIIVVTAFFAPLHFFQHEDENNIAFLFSWILGILMGQVLVTFFRYRKKNLIEILIPSEDQHEQQDYEEYIHCLLRCIDENEIGNFPTFSLLKLHQVNCNNPECLCEIIKTIFLTKTLGKLTKQMIYRFINILIIEVQQNMKNKIPFKIISSYIEFFKLRQKIKSIHESSQILSNCKIGLSQHISIRRLHYLLKEQDHSLTDMTKYMQFSQYLWKFQRLAESAATGCKNYWRELVQQDCEISKILSMAKTIQNDKDSLEILIHQKLLAIFPNNPHTVRIYYELLSSVYKVPKHQISKYLQSKKSSCNGQSNNHKIFHSNEDSTVMCIAEIDGIFEFLRVSSNVTKILQVKSVELLNKSINCIISQTYHELHNQKIKKYLNRSDIQIEQRNANVFVVDFNGNAINCSYQIKILPSAIHGLEFVCFIKKVTKSQRQQQSYVAYYYDEIENREISRGYKNGDILHIDPDLKEIFYMGADQEFEDYDMKIQQILPQWNLETNQIGVMKEDDPKWQIFCGVELVHQTVLDDGIRMKFLAFSHRVELPRLTMNNIKTYHSIKLKSENNLNEFKFEDDSNSRLNLMENMKDGIIETKEKEELSVPIKIKSSWINGGFFVLFFLSIVFISLSFNTRYQFQKIQQNDFQALQICHQIARTVLQISKQCELVVSEKSYMHPNTTLSQIIEETNEKMRKLYKILSWYKIDSEISIQIENQKYTLNNGVYYFLQKASNIIAPISSNKSTQFLNQKYVQNFINGCFKTVDVSNKLLKQSLNGVIGKQNIYVSMESLLIFLITCFIVIRIIKINIFLKQVMKTYETNLHTTDLEIQTKAIDCFVEHISGFVEDKKEEQAQIISTFNFPDTIKTIDKAKTKSFNDEEDTRLLDMKSKITFQQKPHKTPYLSIIIVIICFWVLCKVLIVKWSGSKTFQLQRNNKRGVINSSAKLQTQIERVSYYFSINQRIQEPFQYFQQLQNETLLLNSEDSNLRQSVNLTHLLSTLSLVQENLLNLQEFQSHLKSTTVEISTYVNTKIREQLKQTIKQKGDAILALELALSIISILLFRNLVCQQQDIRTGSELMLKMLGQNKH